MDTGDEDDGHFSSYNDKICPKCLRANLNVYSKCFYCASDLNVIKKPLLFILKEELYRYGQICYYCSRPIDFNGAYLDQILNTESAETKHNCVIACSRCKDLKSRLSNDLVISYLLNEQFYREMK